MAQLTVYAILVLTLVALALRRPAYAVAAVICGYGLEQWSMSVHAFFTTYTQFGNFIVAAIIMVGLVSRFLRQEPILRNLPPVAGWITGLYAFSMLSLAWTLYDGAGAFWIRSLPYIVVMVYLSSLLFHSLDDIRDGIMSALLFGSILLLLLMTTTAVRRGIEFEFGRYNLLTTVGNPLAIAQMCGAVAIIVVLMNFQGAARVWGVARWVVFLGALVLIVRTGSRGEFIGCVLTVVVFMPISRMAGNLRGSLLTAGGLAVAGLLVMTVIDLYVQHSGRWRVEEMGAVVVEGRFTMVADVLRIWASSPAPRWFMGLGSVACHAPDILRRYPHNIPVEILVEEGLIGLTLFCMIVAVSARAFFRSYALVKNDRIALGVLTTIAGLFCYRLVLSLKTGNFLSSTDLMLYAMLLGKYDLFARRQASVARGSPVASRSHAVPFPPR